jgi:hypothetical protein
VQTDPGGRGLARDPLDNLFTACPDDFAAACRIIAEAPTAAIHIVTGFYIATATIPTGETDGPLGAVFLARALCTGERGLSLAGESFCSSALVAGVQAAGLDRFYNEIDLAEGPGELDSVVLNSPWLANEERPVLVAIERVGPSGDGRMYSMRGRDISDHMVPCHETFSRASGSTGFASIGIGDGGNEIGMGKIPHETIVRNIPNGDRIHCRVPTDYLIVAGVSNWGAYALAAGVYALRGIAPSRDLFDPDREREILETMVRAGPLVDGVTGEQTATVDGLTWDEYVKPLVRIREILELSRPD